MVYTCLLVERNEAVLTLTLNRPQVLNALDLRLGQELAQALTREAVDPAVRCVVLTGAGRAFCAGDDLRAGTANAEGRALPEAARRGTVEYAQVIERYLHGEGRWPAIVMAIRALPRPVVAMVNGFAYGAGFNLALACDFRIAAQSATLATPFVRRGMGTGTNLLQQYTGIGVAARLTLTGEPVTATEAEQLGLVTRVVPAAALAAETRAFAAALAAGATATLGYTKQALYEGWTLPPEQAYALQGYAVHRSSFTHDRAEGQSAFIEKRQPRFEGR